MNNIIWTNHALQRLDDRKLTKEQVQQTIYSPDSNINNSDGSRELVREYGIQKVHVITKENEKNETIILSCWINPPIFGSRDHKKKEYYNKQKKTRGIKKFWNTFLNQIGF